MFSIIIFFLIYIAVLLGLNHIVEKLGINTKIGFYLLNLQTKIEKLYSNK